MGDRPAGLINSVSLEHLARKAHAVETGLAACRVEGDWKKGKNSGKDWTSKVDFEMIRRIDPGVSTYFFGGVYMQDAKAEMKNEMTRDADFENVKLKLAERSDVLGPLNA